MYTLIIIIVFCVYSYKNKILNGEEIFTYLKNNKNKKMSEFSDLQCGLINDHTVIEPISLNLIKSSIYFVKTYKHINKLPIN